MNEDEEKEDICMHVCVCSMRAQCMHVYCIGASNLYRWTQCHAHTHTS